MRFHHKGYVSEDPRVQPPEGVGLEDNSQFPDELDVLVVGTGPAGMITAAQLSQFPSIRTRIIDRRSSRLEIGQADGIQPRSVETFKAFGFDQRIVEESYEVSEIAYWNPDPQDVNSIKRTSRNEEEISGITEFPHIIVNQARVLDYFAEFMANSPSRIVPDYGIEFEGLEILEGEEYPVQVTLRHLVGPRKDSVQTVRAKYVLGADGARSKVRSALGLELSGTQSNHAWGVMDILATTNFPDIRTESVIRSHAHGNILLIPREGGYLVRMYVDLGEVPEDDNGSIRNTSIEEIINKAQQVLKPYTLDVKNVAWFSVYEVGHRVTDRFDNVVPGAVNQDPCVFIAGDACHTHSAKAGQGMNVSLQDGFNLGWKIAHVLEGRSDKTLLRTYAEERKIVAQNLIDFDREWSTMMAKNPEEFENPTDLQDFYKSTIEFPSGFMTRYLPSILTGDGNKQHLATGYPIGKRFHSAPVKLVCDGNDAHLGHLAVADGRWRVYVFADKQINSPKVNNLGDWLINSPGSPVVRGHLEGEELDSCFDVKVIYPTHHSEVAIEEVHSVFMPTRNPYGLVDYEKVFAINEKDNIFAARGISEDGAVVIVRPDQYVANICALDDFDSLASFFEPIVFQRTPSREGLHAVH